MMTVVTTGRGVARGLSVRHDHGSQYMSRAFQDAVAAQKAAE